VSAALDAAQLLRPGLLDGVLVVLAGASGDASGSGSVGAPRARAAGDACAALGARTRAWLPGEPVAADADVLIYDGAATFAAALPPRAALSECLDGAWAASHAIAGAAFIGAQRPGKIVYIAPKRAGRHADAACAGLENLARTLSIEWARYRITTVTIAPGRHTGAGELAALCAYVASPAGAYFSGCRLDVRAATIAAG
jgi:NAD(P)-dependent dehydrogenase (short-subunit alcohol dehydrogenase family)